MGQRESVFDRMKARTLDAARIMQPVAKLPGAGTLDDQVWKDIEHIDVSTVPDADDEHVLPAAVVEAIRATV